MKFQLILFVFVSTGLNTIGQTCDPNIKPSEYYNQHLVYQERSGDRCEGFYKSKSSNQDLSVVSLTLGRFNYVLKREEIVTIESSTKLYPTINIRGVGIPLKLYYRLDAVVAANNRLKWPIKDVLINDSIPYRKIGIFGWVERDLQTYFIPIMAKSTLSNPDKDKENVILILSATKNLKNIICEEFHYHNGERMNEKKYLLSVKCNLGNRLEIKLPKHNIDSAELVISYFRSKGMKKLNSKSLPYSKSVKIVY